MESTLDAVMKAARENGARRVHRIVLRVGALSGAEPAALREAVSDGAWLAAMLDFERALANAESLAGVVPAPAAAAISLSIRPVRATNSGSGAP